MCSLHYGIAYVLCKVYAVCHSVYEICVHMYVDVCMVCVYTCDAHGMCLACVTWNMNIGLHVVQSEHPLECFSLCLRMTTTRCSRWTLLWGVGRPVADPWIALLPCEVGEVEPN